MTSSDQEQDAIRKRARALAEDGMPFQMAMAVAAGRMELNEALRRLSLKARVDKLMREHDFGKALATQIAMGHASLDDTLFRRRFAAHRTEHKGRSCLDALVESGDKVTLLVHGQTSVSGVLADVAPYEITLQGEEPLHKLQIKLAHLASDWKAAKKAVKKDRERAKDPKEPIPRPQDRYLLSDKRLFGYVDEKTPIVVTTLEGEVVKGVPMWFSRFEVELEVKGGARIWVFRHGIDNLEAA